jgi:hypothetical protein
MSEISRVDLVIPTDSGERIVGEVFDYLPFLQVLGHDGAHVTGQYIAVESAFRIDLHYRRPQAVAQARCRIHVHAVSALNPFDLLLDLSQDAPALLIGARGPDADEHTPGSGLLIAAKGIAFLRCTSWCSGLGVPP